MVEWGTVAGGSLLAQMVIKCLPFAERAGAYAKKNRLPNNFDRRSVCDFRLLIPCNYLLRIVACAAASRAMGTR